MKSITDLLQILLSLPGFLGYIACLVIILAVAQIAKILGYTWELGRMVVAQARRIAIRITWMRMLWFSMLALPVWFLALPITDGLQWVEQRYFAPLVFVPDTSNAMTAIYEMELARHCSPHECEVIRSRTYDIAILVGSTPQAIYEVAYSECGMDPFRMRTDGVAAGWIQFTRAGLANLGATLDQVKAACQRRDVDFIMDLTERYLLDRAKCKSMPRSCDVYCCVFAPGYLGASDDTTLYCAAQGDAYWLNAGLDGYYIQQDNQGRDLIMQSRKARDGRLTINDLRLALAAKKSALAARYKKET